eukprot:TRINITY_DN2502_c0_g1_i2.p1 TRINITY_DN2502_c0_g1~~TRINITY_DN2502_c0_g1_i2.p1  ORF type:complete len:404 (+),score=46.32 TRINITY_DN2502_c0_g1_i2:858-2069(+)
MVGATMKLPSNQIRVLFFFCFGVHFCRILIIPLLARLAGYEDYAETDKVLRAVGYHQKGPCSLPRPPRICTVKDRIHIVLVSAQWDREPFTQDETEVVIKSVLSSTTCKIHFHFMVSGEMEEWGLTYIMEALGATPFDSVGPISPKLVRHDNHVRADEMSEDEDEDEEVDAEAMVAYTIHPIPVVWIREQAELLGINITHHSGEAGFSKLFLSQILWNVQRAIYLDVDMMFADDIGLLWSFFADMDEDEELLLFMGDNHPTAYGPRARYPFCSCQLIMDLERIRQANLTRLILESFGDQKAMEVWGFRPGDQWVWTMMCMNNPEKCRTLPKIWNVSGCAKPRFLGLNARDRDQNGTCWKVAHFNCMGVRDKQYYALLNTDWDDSIEYIKQLPWKSLRRPSLSR